RAFRRGPADTVLSPAPPPAARACPPPAADSPTGPPPRPVPAGESAAGGEVFPLPESSSNRRLRTLGALGQVADDVGGRALLRGAVGGAGPQVEAVRVA